jgi:Ca2+-transporting ATPase
VPPDTMVADRHCMLHAGTAVIAGRGRMVVTATGSSTEVGKIATLLATTAARQTPLQRRLTRFGHQVAVATMALCALVLLLGLLQGEPVERMVLVAISLAVAAIPESLPAVVVLSLAGAAQRMARRSVVVRTLPAVEALGAVTTIASDKTGTLTEGGMSVPELWTSAGLVTVRGNGYSPAGLLDGTPSALAAIGALMRGVALCNDAELLEDQGTWIVAGDPMEGALQAVAAPAGQDLAALRRGSPRTATYAFDSTRMRMTTVHQLEDDGFLVISKRRTGRAAGAAGAPAGGAAFGRGSPPGHDRARAARPGRWAAAATQPPGGRR